MARIEGKLHSQPTTIALRTVTKKSVNSTKEILQEHCAASRQHEISKHYLIRKWHCKKHHQISERNLTRKLCSKQQQISQGHLHNDLESMKSHTQENPVKSLKAQKA